MVVLRVPKGASQEEILFDGSLDEAMKKYNELTEKYEKMGAFMVNEIKIGTTGCTYLREFATSENGHVFDLIIVGGVARMITTKK